MKKQMRERRRITIYSSSSKQKLIENMIQKQYDQLLEICEKTKAEVAYLSKDVDETDFAGNLEIDKTNALIASIEQDIRTKKQHVYEVEIKNKYQQLFSIYETTKKEVDILENLLQHHVVQAEHGKTPHERLISNQPPEPKRERLNLRSPMPTLDLSKTVDSDHDERASAKLERLEKFNKQIFHETQERHVAATTTIADESTLLEKSESTPVESEMAIESDPTPVESEIQKESESTPAVFENAEVPLVRPPLPLVPEISKVPPLVPEAPLSKKLESRTKKQSNADRIDPSKKKRSQKKRGVSQRKSRSALSIFFNCMFYFVLVFSIAFVLLFGNPNSQAIPRRVMGFSVMRVVTSSMEPTIPVNSLIITRATDPNALNVDDVVTYGRANNTTLTHRIYEILEDHTPGRRGFVLKGDAFATPDPEIAEGQNIIGRVVFISYPLGRTLMFFQNQFWLVITIIVLILTILFVLQSLFKTKK